MRPRAAPANMRASSPRSSPGSRQLLSGPASSRAPQAMKVRDSTRATSDGGERASHELRHWPPAPTPAGTTAPLSASSDSSRACSRALPSHRCTRAGCSAAADDSIKARSLALVA